MLKSLTSAALILIFAASLCAGSPAGSREQVMSGMDGMDCCRKAALASDAPGVQAARLCCAINCTQPGPVRQTGQVRPQTAPRVADAQQPATARSPLAGLKPPARARQSRDQVSNSPPTYIRHLSLLI